MSPWRATPPSIQKRAEAGSDRPMKALLFFLALTGTGFTWWLNRAEATNLRTQIAAWREQSSELNRLRDERERLRQLQPDVAELARLRRAAGQRTHAAPEVDVRVEQLPARVALVPGEWSPPDAWGNRGDATPLAALETVLWAGAGGETAALARRLQLDDAIRIRVQALLERLPDAARQMYSSPEHLLAAFTAKAIPLTHTQVVWQQQLGPDDAVISLFLKSSAAETVTGPVDLSGSHSNAPPQVPRNGKVRTVIISLHRSDAGWRLSVPSSAVEQIERELVGAK